MVFEAILSLGLIPILQGLKGAKDVHTSGGKPSLGGKPHEVHMDTSNSGQRPQHPFGGRPRGIRTSQIFFLVCEEEWTDLGLDSPPDCIELRTLAPEDNSEPDSF